MPTIVIQTMNAIDEFGSKNDIAIDGSETVIQAGTNATVTGTGTSADPYVISGPALPDGSETKLTAGTNVTVTGTGTTADPYVINSSSNGGGGGGGGGNQNADMLQFGTASPTTNGQHDGEEYFVTSTGDETGTILEQWVWDHQTTTWIERPGSSVIDIKPALAPVLNMLSTPPSTPNDQDSYIVLPTATGAWVGKEGDIATWDAANSVWELKSPTNLDKTTVLTGANAGIWQYSSTTDSWTQVQSGITIPTPELGATAGNVKLPALSAMCASQGAGTPIGVIQNRAIWIWGDTGQITPGDRTAQNSVPRQVAVNYNSLTEGYVKSASAFPEFVDWCWNDIVSLAIDSNGKLWAAGGAVQGTGLTTTPTGTTAVPTAPLYGWSPVRFFQQLADKVAKVYLPSFTSSATHSMVITQTGVGYVTGTNGNGQLGLGDTTARANWVQFPITNLKYAILGQGYTVVVTNAGQVYFCGADSGGFTGSTGTKSTPVLVTSGAATYEKSVSVAPQSAAQTIWVVKTDGTLFAGGNNANGQQGRGNLTATTSVTQVPGITNAKFVVGGAVSQESCALVRSDNTLAFAGFNRNGKQSITANASAVNNTTFTAANGSFQGLVADVLHGYTTTAVRTADGLLYTTGDNQWSGTGRGNSNAWADQNRFREVAMPNPVVGMIGINEATNSNDGYLLLTNIGSVYGFGSYMATRYTNANSIMYSPARIPLWGDTGVEPLDMLPMAADVVGTITGTTASSVTNIVDGLSNQTVTFTVAYTGGVFGTVSLAGSTVTGADITQVSLSTTSVVVQNGSGTFTVSFVINAADIAALVPPDTQAQNYTVTLLINGA
jgi:alpha-tubulin suppressor-like RCC1 family protein